jgi:hypothetical protein
VPQPLPTPMLRIRPSPRTTRTRCTSRPSRRVGNCGCWMRRCAGLTRAITANACCAGRRSPLHDWRRCPGRGTVSIARSSRKESADRERPNRECECTGSEPVMRGWRQLCRGGCGLRCSCRRIPRRGRSLWIACSASGGSAGSYRPRRQSTRSSSQPQWTCRSFISTPAPTLQRLPSISLNIKACGEHLSRCPQVTAKQRQPRAAEQRDKLKGPRHWLCSSRQLLRGS